VRRSTAVTALLCTALIGLAAPPALADHTSPGSRLAPELAQPSAGAVVQGEGSWSYVGGLGPMQGSDLEFFSKGGKTFMSAGTLGQAPTGTPGFVGQRIVQLTDATGAQIAPKVVADHGSAHCDANSSATGLQHDVQAVPLVDTELLVDTTDATGRCHDTPGGGMEILDVSGLGEPGFEVRELALIRFNGLSHTVTADRDRPGILYNNGSDFAPASLGQLGTVGQPWTDVVDARSCLGLAGKTLAEKRAACQPTVYRIAYDPAVTSKKLPNGSLSEPANCHDITYQDNRLHCGALNASFVVDVTNLLGADGTIAGTPLPCTTTPGSRTGASVTDCALRPAGASSNPNAAQANAAWEALGRPQATGPVVLGGINHPGRACPDPSVVTCNTNLAVLSTEGVAVSHEADPTPDGRHMLVTDERGGGVVPPGATCAPGLDNPYGNGGIHVFDISDPANTKYALQPNGKKAVFIGTSPTPSPTFCTVHVIEQVPGEQRIIAGYYDGGTKIIDYDINDKGEWTFKEVASYRLPGANTWASEVFKTVDHPDGTRTYSFASTSFALGEGTARGIDVFNWRGKPNPLPGAGDGDAAAFGKSKAAAGRDNGKGAPAGKSRPASSEQAAAPAPAPAGPGASGGAAAAAAPAADSGQALSTRSVSATSPLPAPASADGLLLLLAGTLLPVAAGVRLVRRRVLTAAR
jgi:hypothetical protein